MYTVYKNEKLLSYLNGFKYANSYEVNYIRIPVNVINASPGTEEIFNNIYFELIHDSHFSKMALTKSGGISIKIKEIDRRFYSYAVQKWDGIIELIIHLDAIRGGELESRYYRIQYRLNNFKNKKGEEDFISGAQSVNLFKKILKRKGIDLTEYANAEEDGERINGEITPPDIKLTREYYAGYKISFKACHLDFHKFYMSGLMLSHPEFTAAIKEMDRKAKSDQKYKVAMAATIGKFHSKGYKYKYAQLAKDAINTAYKRYYEVYEKLAKERRILATNTDGIWYEGDPWHGIYEGPGLGYWQNDIINVEVRFKSAGSYEYRDYDTKANYKPVVRGRTKLEKIKPRQCWEWGDIFNIDSKILMWKFDDDRGVVWESIKV